MGQLRRAARPMLPLKATHLVSPPQAARPLQVLQLQALDRVPTQALRLPSHYFLALSLLILLIMASIQTPPRRAKLLL